MRRRLAIAYALVLAACGSRTALVGDEAAEISDDASVSQRDGGDASRDADAQVRLDGSPDVFVDDCPDASVTFIYLISEARELYSYNPVDGIFRDIGTVNCPTTFTQAFSMAVDRQGTAYVLFYGQPDPSQPAQGDLFRVSTANASCKAIPEYAPNQAGFNVFGTGFATNGGGPSESLYVQGAGDFQSATGLATIDTTTFNVTFLGNNNPAILGGELTGTGDGRLFGFFELDQSGTFNLGELDKTNGQLLSQTPVGGGIVTGTGFSVAFWGGDFFFFTVPDGNTVATRYRPSDQSYANVASLAGVTIVGAGVSTCAPQ
ncbi:MAG: hypothetical protein ABI183_09890 [Polyangiaceae bacterium]